MKVRSLYVPLLALLFAGCVAPTTSLSPSGGSRAAGVVDFSYEYSLLDPEPNVNKGTDEALVRCKAWGYKGVLPFERKTSQCNDRGAYGCNRWFVTYHYQCTVVADPIK